MALERLRECHYGVSLPFVSSLVPGIGVERRQFIFLFYVHTYSIHIYLYHNLRNQNVEFPIKSLFFNNRLFLNVIKTIILCSYYRALEEGWGREGEDALGVLFLLFLQGFIFDCFFFLLAISVLLASVLSLTVAKTMTCSKYSKNKIFFLL
uniref:Uncharacterized protein n=1 Tax=Myotis myotis TaxID=51298 RepID=A0A7J7SRY6_MYOMY|nr:hypothetical protein mMyoMyo1_009373 [Myotis myotis]